MSTDEIPRTASQKRWDAFFAGDLPAAQAAVFQRKWDRLTSLNQARLRARTNKEFLDADAKYSRAQIRSGLYKILNPSRCKRDASRLRQLLWPMI